MNPTSPSSFHLRNEVEWLIADFLSIAITLQFTVSTTGSMIQMCTNHQSNHNITSHATGSVHMSQKVVCIFHSIFSTNHIKNDLFSVSISISTLAFELTINMYNTKFNTSSGYGVRGHR